MYWNLLYDWMLLILNMNACTMFSTHFFGVWEFRLTFLPTGYTNISHIETKSGSKVAERDLLEPVRALKRIAETPTLPALLRPSVEISNW